MYDFNNFEFLNLFELFVLGESLIFFIRESSLFLFDSFVKFLFEIGVLQYRFLLFIVIYGLIIMIVFQINLEIEIWFLVQQELQDLNVIVIGRNQGVYLGVDFEDFRFGDVKYKGGQGEYIDEGCLLVIWDVMF